jgi:peptide/nickel transport system substrate-binding protein
MVILTAQRRVLLIAAFLTASLGLWASGTEEAAAPAATDAGLPPELTPEVFVVTPDIPLASYQQAQELAEMEQQGKIPPLMERLPDIPPMVPPPDRVGRYGGTLRHFEAAYTTFGSITRYMDEALLARSTPNGAHLYGNVAHSLEVSEDLTTFIIRMRPGLKWSDGHEVTSEDVLFNLNDIQLYSPEPEVKAEDLYPSSMRIGGSPAKVSAVDDYTIMIRTAVPWADYFALANWHAVNKPRPAHYLKQFHPRYNEALADNATEAWEEFGDVHLAYTNPDRPSLGPWIADTVNEGDFMTLQRNPFYWKTDIEGRQLPYADQLRITYVKDAEVLKLQLAGGQYDWGGMSFNPDTVLYQQQEAGNYSLVPGENSQYWVGLKINHAWLAIDHDDPQEQKLVELLRNFDFLKAMQLGIDNQLSMAAFVGPELAEFTAVTEGHPLLQTGLPVGMNTADPRVQKLWDFMDDWMRYDPEEANRLLDALGLNRGDDGLRTYPDGSPIEITAGIFSDWEPAGEVSRQQIAKWEKELGIKIYVESQTWSAAARKWYGREAIAIVDYGTGWYDWALTLQLGGLYQYPLRDWVLSDGATGLEPIPELKEHWLKLKELADASATTSDQDEKMDLAIQATEIAIYNHLDAAWFFGAQDRRWYRHNRIVNNPGGVPIGYIREWTRMEQWWINE